MPAWPAAGLPMGRGAWRRTRRRAGPWRAALWPLPWLVAPPAPAVACIFHQPALGPSTRLACPDGAWASRPALALQRHCASHLSCQETQACERSQRRCPALQFALPSVRLAMAGASAGELVVRERLDCEAAAALLRRLVVRPGTASGCRRVNESARCMFGRVNWQDAVAAPWWLTRHGMQDLAPPCWQLLPFAASPAPAGRRPRYPCVTLRRCACS